MSAVTAADDDVVVVLVGEYLLFDRFQALNSNQS